MRLEKALISLTGPIEHQVRKLGPVRVRYVCSRRAVVHLEERRFVIMCYRFAVMFVGPIPNTENFAIK